MSSAVRMPPGTRPTAGGWPAEPGSKLVTLQVVSSGVVARDTVAFALALPGTKGAPASHRPGQFITLEVPSADGGILRRSYSLCGPGSADRPWEITIKRVAGGVISNHLIDNLRPGMLVQATLPQGSFTLPQPLRRDVPLILVAAGSGITPIYAMLRALAALPTEHRPPVWLHYAYHSPEDAIFAQGLAALDREQRWLRQQHYVSTKGSHLRARELVAAHGREASRPEWYVCGPVALKKELQVAALAAGIQRNQFHAEVFASPATKAARMRASGATATTIRLADSGAMVDAQPGETVLEALERGGYRPDYSCRAGACGTCRLRLLKGSVRNGQGDDGALSPREVSHGYILSCVAEPEGAITLASAGPYVAAPVAARAGSRGQPPRQRNSGGARTIIRFGLIAAAASVFATAWHFTDHTPTSSTTSASVSSATGTSSTSSGTGSSGSSSGSSSSSSGSSSSSSASGLGGFFGSSGSVSNQPSTNTVTGVS